MTGLIKPRFIILLALLVSGIIYLFGEPNFFFNERNCVPFSETSWTHNLDAELPAAISDFQKRCISPDAWKSKILVSANLNYGGLWGKERSYEELGYTDASQKISNAFNVPSSNVQEYRALKGSNTAVFAIEFGQSISGHFTSRGILTLRHEQCWDQYFRFNLSGIDIENLKPHSVRVILGLVGSVSQRKCE